ncbi:MAG TPA: DUF2905 domain-containing protein [Firmicutes bacterium]|nr:DUF2905 domain-containing protein [Bacillota bacterium]
MVIGIVVFLTGLLLFTLGRFLPFGRLPGDIIIKRENIVVYFPIVTMLLLSIIFSLILNLLRR